MISRNSGLPNSGTMRPRRGKAATFSASRMILEPTFSAAGGLSFEINWPISSKSATAGSVQIRVAIASLQPAHILWAISEQLSQFQQTIQSVAGIIAFGPPVNHPLFCAAVTTQVRIPSRPLVLSKSVSSSKSRRGDQSENEASHMYKVSHSTQCRAHILLVDRI